VNLEAADRARPSTARDRVARVVTETTGPPVLAGGLLLLVAWHSAPTSGAGLLWGLLAAVLASAVPFGYIVRGVRRGRWADHHVGVREQRRRPLLVGLASVTAALALLAAWNAPRELLALVAAMLTGLAVALLVTHYWWKVSIHTAVAAGTAVILVLVFGPALFAVWPLVAVVGWSRVQLGAHTPGQVAGGGVLGGLVAWVVFSLLR
jgi:membrane-associated phospholipid phosphatase